MRPEAGSSARAATLALGLALAARASPAWAQQPQQPQQGAAPTQAAMAQAEQRFFAGEQHYDARRFEAALAEFRASFALYPSPNSRLFVARCLRELGRLGEAAVEYDGTVVDAGTQRRYAATAAAARGEREALEPRIARVRVDLGASTPETAEVRVEGRVVARAALSEPVAVTPGDVAITLHDGGREVARRDVSIVAQGVVTVRIAPAAQVAAGGGGHSGDGRGGDDRRDARRAAVAPDFARAAAWAALATGGVALATFGALAGVTEGHYRGLASRCQGVCTDADVGAIDAGRGLQTATNVMLVVGLVAAVAGGAALVLVRPARPAVTVGLTGNGAAVGGAF